ncbi:MAG: DUF3696 domain-containing protein [Saprospiraceae bacterium]
MKLTIKHFKCFSDVTVQFGQLTVLAGANSVGKSTVVQALLLARTIVEKYRNSESWTGMKEGKNVMFPSDNFSLNGPFHLNLGNTIEVLNRNAYDNKIGFSFEFGKDRRLGFIFAVPDKEDAYSLVLDDIRLSKASSLEDLPLTNFFFYYLNAERLGPRIRHEVDDLPYLHTGWQGEYAIQIVGGNKTLPMSEDRCFDATQTTHLLEQSRLWLENIVPGANLGNAEIIKGIKTAEVDYEKSKPPNIGFGISYVLPIIVNGLIASEGSMFIVENPEAHLHPYGQSQIGKFLAKIASTGVQVVVETHSEHVINGIRIATLNGTIANESVFINFFQREGGEVKVNPIRVNEAGDLTAYPKGFFDQEQRDIAEIIRQKRRKMEENP